MAVLLYPNPLKDSGFAVTRRAAAILRENGSTVLMGEAFQPSLQGEDICFLPPAQALARADQVVTIGGDGTLLRASAECIAAGKPVLGINLGRTGFLATCEVGELPQKLARLATGAFTLECRGLLQAEAGAGAWQATAVNDILLYGASRLHPMDYSVYCDGTFVCRYRSDGVIAATPTGSTAYSLSAGGPILDVVAPVFEVNAICAHSVNTAPLVFSASRRLTLVAEAENRDLVYVCADSNPPFALEPGGGVEITTATTSLHLVSFGEAAQFEAIENKLKRR
ncbi:MAG: NAD(+)/NADH kinase [Gemmiger sp.]|nr:NAD(+)/NADH kinase [Gemmiger sp.]